jgi:hypothetical protein
MTRTIVGLFAFASLAFSALAEQAQPKNPASRLNSRRVDLQKSLVGAWRSADFGTWIFRRDGSMRIFGVDDTYGYTEETFIKYLVKGNVLSQTIYRVDLTLPANPDEELLRIAELVRKNERDILKGGPIHVECTMVSLAANKLRIVDEKNGVHLFIRANSAQ